MKKSNDLVEKIVLFAVFIVFAVLVVCFAYGWDDIMVAKSSDADTLSFFYITSSKTDSTGSVNVSDRVNINTADAAELDKLPGIGLTRAKAIIDYRNENGAFKNIADIKNVNGIGDGIFEEIKDHITVD